jgi:uncharacterized protein (DUF1800 family)
MVRSNQPLVERMTLIFHDWFATSNDTVNDWSLMLGQNALLRSRALGSFRDLLLDITHDPAMLIWLNGIDNTKYDPNENYAREVMELFTLGADRGAYTEQDVRNLARAYTGWRATWVDGVGFTNFRYDANRPTPATRRSSGTPATTTGRRLRPLPQQLLPRVVLRREVVELLRPHHARRGDPGHAAGPLRVQRLRHQAGRARDPAPPRAVRGQRAHEAAGRVHGRCAAWHPAVHHHDRVVVARRRRRQFLFYPPNVSGWDDARWLDTSSWRGRWDIASYVTRGQNVDPWDDAHPYDASEDGPTALARARAALGNPA